LGLDPKSEEREKEKCVCVMNTAAFLTDVIDYSPSIVS